MKKGEDSISGNQETLRRVGLDLTLTDSTKPDPFSRERKRARGGSTKKLPLKTERERLRLGKILAVDIIPLLIFFFLFNSVWPFGLDCSADIFDFILGEEIGNFSPFE